MLPERTKGGWPVEEQTTRSETRFEPATESDIPEITRVMTRAFDDDSRRFRGVPRGGPPGYDTGDFLRKWMPEGTPYKVLEGDIVVGCFIVFQSYPEAGQNVLGTIFIDPDYQGRGIGSRSLQFVHDSFPAHTWRLDTPGWATRNHHFYEKHDYRKIDERPEPDDPSGFNLYVYERVTE